MTIPEHVDSDDATGVLDPGMVRAGAAAAARRRELDISQRSLAADGIINAGALIAFEKGRSWPRDRTRAKLEEVLRWPPGTITGSGRGGGSRGALASSRRPSAAATRCPLIAQAVVAAVNTLGATIDALPALDDPDFTPRITAILSDLRQLEAVAARAAAHRQGDPAADQGAEHGAPPDPTSSRCWPPRRRRRPLGQRLYAARRSANLTIARNRPGRGGHREASSRPEPEQPCQRAAVGDDRSPDRAARLALTPGVSGVLGRVRRGRGSARRVRRRSR